MPLNQVIGTLGCSKELWDLISCINKLRKLQSSFFFSDRSCLSNCRQLTARIRDQLYNLEQEIYFAPEAGSGVFDTNRIKAAAEFYRVAACLYLEQVAQDPSSGKYIQALVHGGFALLGEMDVCTSPWPLFILACHSNSDELRIRILRTLEAMKSKRRIGNVHVLEQIIEAVWRQQDILGINTDAHSSPVDWRNVIAMEAPMQTFV